MVLEEATQEVAVAEVLTEIAAEEQTTGEAEATEAAELDLGVQVNLVEVVQSAHKAL
jgi:hypothetical protein